MKKLEKILGIIAIITLVLHLNNVSGATLLMSLTFFTLTFIYFYLGFAFFNNIRLRDITKKESYKGVNTMKILGAIFGGLTLSITLLGILFKLQFWPGASLLLIIGLSALLIVTIISLIKYKVNKSHLYKNIIIRAAIIGICGIILLMSPSNILIEIKYRNHPEYIEAIKKLNQDPDNIELRKKVEEEYKKMYKSNTPD